MARFRASSSNGKNTLCTVASIPERRRTYDTRSREQLVTYVLRRPLAQERLMLLPDELVRIALKRPFTDGTVAIDLDPLSLLMRRSTRPRTTCFDLVTVRPNLVIRTSMRPALTPIMPNVLETFARVPLREG